MVITLYTKPDCLLCEELKADLVALQREYAFVIHERNIEADAGDFERFRYLIPVLDVADGPLLYPPHSWQRTTQAIAAAAQRRCES